MQKDVWLRKQEDVVGEDDPGFAGELKVITYEEGKEVGTYSLKSAKEELHIQAIPDRTEEIFHCGKHTSFDGKAMAIIRPTAAGSFTLKVETEGFVGNNAANLLKKKGKVWV